MENSGFIPRAPGKGNITAIRPKTWNAIADVVNGGRVGAGGAAATPGADGMGRGWVWIKNNSGSDRSRFDCMSLGDPTMALTTDGQVDVVFAATTADPAKTPAILLEPIANGRVGRAVIYGLCLAKVTAGSTSLLSAVPEASSHSLSPVASGTIKLLTAPSASVATVAPVVLGTSSGGGDGILFVTRAGGIAARTSTTLPHTFPSATVDLLDPATGNLYSPNRTETVYNMTNIAIAHVANRPRGAVLRGTRYFIDVDDC